MAEGDIRDALQRLAGNFRWVWDRPTQDVFASIDPQAWRSRRDPAGLLAALGPGRLAELAAEPAFVQRVRRAESGLADYLAGKPSEVLVAYFCMEHGVAPALRTYAGGLGVLAGDIEKTASDLGVPMVAVGLLYQWRLRQRLSYGWQNERWEAFEPQHAGLQARPEADITVEVGGEKVAVRVWRADVGRVELYLLDSNVPDNPQHLRDITDRLYGGDAEHRLQQEVILGMGGVRALRALGRTPTVWHANEGHAGFLGLERIRDLTNAGHDLDEAIRAVREATVFTTHTAVAAGFDLFDRRLIERYFATWAQDCGVSIDWLMRLGHFPDQPADEPFNMAVLCARLSAHINAVSRLHREITEQRVLGRLWPGQAAPIVAVTNGVHPQTWASSRMAALFDKYLAPGWEYAGPQAWEQVWQIPDDELWQARQESRAELVEFVREYLPATLAEQGWGDDLGWAHRVLDPDALTVVVARRAAEYKETDLLVSDPERLKAFSCNPTRPVNVLYAGIAHPKDQGGKERIKRIVECSLRDDVRANVVYLPGYDMRLAMALLAGADIWLNHPRRGEEACGTSFMKSVYCGGRLLTTADGGADELVVHGRNGWLIGDRTFGASREAMADSAFSLLEREVLPEFYDRDSQDLPRRWLAGIKSSLATLGWQVSSGPTVQAYDRLYRQSARSLAAMPVGSPHG
jgi:glycogen phosphorylase